MVDGFENIKLGQPAQRALNRIGCETLEDVTRYSEGQLLALHGFGPKALKILKSHLEQRGLALSEVEEACDMIHAKGVREKKLDVIDGYTIKRHANGVTVWSKGKVLDGQPDGYWEWYRPDGTLKRSGYFYQGKPIGEWTTYDQNGAAYKSTKRG